MWSLLRGTLRLRWPALIVTVLVVTTGTMLIAANALLLDAGIRHRNQDIISLAAVFGGLTVMIMVTLVAVVYSFVLAQRGAEIALGRAVGMSPMQLRMLVILEVVALGSASTSAGLGASGPLARQILAIAVQAGVAPPTLEVPARLLPMAVAAAIGVAVNLGAGLISVQRWASLSPADGLAEFHDLDRRMSRTRAVSAVVVLLGALALSLVTLLVMRGPVASATASPAVFLWTGGMALVTPLLLKPCLAVLGFLVSLTGMPARLAAHGARARIGPLAPVSASVLLAVGAAASLLTMQTGTDAAADGGPDVEGIVNFLLIGLVLAYATLTFGNTVALWALGSRREAAVFRTLGATTSVSWLVLMLELAMGVLSGMILGLVVALLTVLPFLMALQGDVLLSIGAWIQLGSVLGATVTIAMLIGAVVVALAVRRSVVTVLAT